MPAMLHKATLPRLTDPQEAKRKDVRCKQGMPETGNNTCTCSRAAERDASNADNKHAQRRCMLLDIIKLQRCTSSLTGKQAAQAGLGLARRPLNGHSGQRLQPCHRPVTKAGPGARAGVADLLCEGRTCVGLVRGRAGGGRAGGGRLGGAASPARHGVRLAELCAGGAGAIPAAPTPGPARHGGPPHGPRHARASAMAARGRRLPRVRPSTWGSTWRPAGEAGGALYPGVAPGPGSYPRALRQPLKPLPMLSPGPDTRVSALVQEWGTVLRSVAFPAQKSLVRPEMRGLEGHTWPSETES